ncbi:unnamed protein product [Heligmosomoides polygyrus]|uniref:Uncharacterized protein n=1 Tax=Heligmosomoides polygyrus TaxID=6339 RepID=A0A3P7Y242_HELPZ|nr:unnamed protein product [Heligmosomoides polygyrus]
MDAEDTDRIVSYFPPKPGAFTNYGRMFVNTKKVALTYTKLHLLLTLMLFQMDEETRFVVYTLEVLPDGCSNSLLVKLIKAKNDTGKSPSTTMILRMLRIVGAVCKTNCKELCLVSVNNQVAVEDFVCERYFIALGLYIESL